MDYSLGALKLLCNQLKNARKVPSQKTSTLGGILFQRAWLQLEAKLQGVLVSTPSSSDSGSGCFYLDDGTGVIELLLSGDLLSRNWETGMYVMVVGGHFLRDGDTAVVKVLTIEWKQSDTVKEYHITELLNCANVFSWWISCHADMRWFSLPTTSSSHRCIYVLLLELKGVRSKRARDLVHKMVDLSPFPDRESMWYLEVIEVFKMFYKPQFQE